MTLLCVSQWFLTLNNIEQIVTKSFIKRILRKVSWTTTMKVVVIFGIFGTLCAMVLLISPKQNELEICACTQIEALEKQNGWIYPGNALDLSERDRNTARTL